MPAGRPPKNETESQTDKTEKEIAMQDAAQEEVVVEKSKTKGTKPGWRPSSQLPNLKAKAGFHAKWSSVNKLTERVAEGWQIMKPSDNVGREIINVDVNDVGSLTGALRYRDLVAIMIPKDKKAERDEWLRNENAEAVKGVLKKTDQSLQQNGVETYAPTGQSGRVVIN